MCESEKNAESEEIQISLTVNGRFIVTRGSLSLSLMPKPTAVIELDDLPNEVITKPGESYVFTLENGNTIQAMCVSLTQSSQGSNAQNKSVFIPQRGKWTLTKTKEPLNSVTVQVVNFPNFSGSEFDVVNYSQDGNSISSWVPTIALSVRNWAIKVTAVPKLNEKLEEIRRSDGFWLHIRVMFQGVTAVHFQSFKRETYYINCGFSYLLPEVGFVD